MATVLILVLLRLVIVLLQPRTTSLRRSAIEHVRPVPLLPVVAIAAETSYAYPGTIMIAWTWAGNSDGTRYPGYPG
eukprot:764661-Rhodomonas_salina.1